MGSYRRHAFEPSDHSDQRRLVDVTPIQMMTAREVVQFIDEITVTAADKHVHQEHQER